MQCYLINLERSEDRRLHMERQFNRAGLGHTRINAVDAATTPIDDDGLWGLLRPAERACLLSHIACWQQIARAEDDQAAVFEDDIHLDPRAKSVLEILARDHADKDLIKLETLCTTVKIAPKAQPLAEGISLHRLLGGHMGSAGYVISRRLAQNLLQMTATQTRLPVDILLFSRFGPVFTQNAIYQVVPALCIQDASLPDRDGPRLVTTIGDTRPARPVTPWERIRREAMKLGDQLQKGITGPIPYEGP